MFVFMEDKGGSLKDEYLANRLETKTRKYKDLVRGHGLQYQMGYTKRMFMVLLCIGFGLFWVMVYMFQVKALEVALLSDDGSAASLATTIVENNNQSFGLFIYILSNIATAVFAYNSGKNDKDRGKEV